VSYTPMIQQYLQIKEEYRDYILFFRMGDFYEMFFDDAVTASKDLEIALTARDGGGGKRVPMCGVPHHAAESYIARLIEKGRCVAICEQMEDPRQAKGLVKREVTRVITPGTVVEGQCLEEKSNNYLAAAVVEEDGCGLAFTDVSTGLFRVTEFNDRGAFDQLMDELYRLQPAEVLVTSRAAAAIGPKLAAAGNTLVNVVDSHMFERERAAEAMYSQFNRSWMDTGAGRLVHGLRAAGAVLAYLMQTQRRSLQQINKPQVYFTAQYMQMDDATRRNLELTRSLKDGSRWGTLAWVLDYTATAMGARMLKSWIEQPLVNPNKINERLDAVEELVQNLLVRKKLKEVLGEVYDLERLVSRVVYGNANARDLLALRKSFDVLPVLKKLLADASSGLLTGIREKLDDMSDVNQLLHGAIVDDPPVSVRDGAIIKDGYHPEVDRLRAASRDGKSWLAQMEAEEREKTGIKSLKIGYNKVFGYYLEVTKPNLSQVPGHYVRKQTLVNAERFITPQLKEYEDIITGAEERLTQLEYQLFCQLRDKVTSQVSRIQGTAEKLATLDVLVSLAEAAERAGYVRPQVQEGGKKIIIKDGRHPVVERVLGVGNYVPNDTLLDERNRLILLTGPNMAGKSTYMRQVALIVLMAQAGSFVPAASAQIDIVDRIFTRIGASDDLAGGRSTFMVEMSECCNIVNNATGSSLIIMDEVGRGTSTYDGISIARALVEHIHNVIGARTLFSTHYHELTDLDSLPGVSNYTMTIREKGEEVIFLRKVVPGKVDKSYGIQVARLAGLPDPILNRAKKVMADLERRNSNGAAVNVDYTEPPPAGRCNGCTALALWKRLQQTDVLRITPMQAINLLARWKQKVKNEAATDSKLLQDNDMGSENS